MEGGPDERGVGPYTCNMCSWLCWFILLLPWIYPFVSKGQRKEANRGHCLLAWPKEHGGLGILDLHYFGLVLRVRWLWFGNTRPEIPWSALPVLVSYLCWSLVYSIHLKVGNGASTKFWTHGWLNGCSIKLLAPRLFACVRKKRASKRTIQDEDIQGHYSRSRYSLSSWTYGIWYRLWPCNLRSEISTNGCLMPRLSFLPNQHMGPYFMDQPSNFHAK